ncbi:MAG: WecB/TagA/CpsF family glycosyltransferase [Coriobacteriia bacterium]|nr:WecB/TagA/CpsF family glycosyltransferase [Coriobacteriia bacterium]
MRAELFGVPLDLLTMDESVARCAELVESGRAAQHVVINAGKVVMMQDVPGLREAIASCEIVNADGQSVVWAGRMLGLDVPERVAGIDLMWRLLAEAEEHAWPVYLLGAREEVLQGCLARILEVHPRLVVAGARNGYFDDDAAVARTIRDSGARLLFVGITSPKKEFFLAERLPEMGPVFAMGVGGSFDVIAGLTKRAPVWMQRTGLEWFYRFAQEPRRMWKRYLVGNSRFALLTLKEKRRRTA